MKVKNKHVILLSWLLIWQNNKFSDERHVVFEELEQTVAAIKRGGGGSFAPDCMRKLR